MKKLNKNQKKLLHEKLYKVHRITTTILSFLAIGLITIGLVGSCSKKEYDQEPNQANVIRQQAPVKKLIGDLYEYDIYNAVKLPYELNNQTISHNLYARNDYSICLFSYSYGYQVLDKGSYVFGYDENHDYEDGVNLFYFGSDYSNRDYYHLDDIYILPYQSINCDLDSYNFLSSYMLGNQVNNFRLDSKTLIDLPIIDYDGNLSVGQTYTKLFFEGWFTISEGSILWSVSSQIPKQLLIYNGIDLTYTIYLKNSSGDKIAIPTGFVITSSRLINYKGEEYPMPTLSANEGITYTTKLGIFIGRSMGNNVSYGTIRSISGSFNPNNDINIEDIPNNNVDIFSSVFSVIGSAFSGLLPFLNTPLGSGITVGTLILIPLVVTILIIVIKIARSS